MKLGDITVLYDFDENQSKFPEIFQVKQHLQEAVSELKTCANAAHDPNFVLEYQRLCFVVLHKIIPLYFDAFSSSEVNAILVSMFDLASPISIVLYSLLQMPPQRGKINIRTFSFICDRILAILKDDNKMQKIIDSLDETLAKIITSIPARLHNFCIIDLTILRSIPSILVSPEYECFIVKQLFKFYCRVEKVETRTRITSVLSRFGRRGFGELIGAEMANFNPLQNEAIVDILTSACCIEDNALEGVVRSLVARIAELEGVNEKSKVLLMADLIQKISIYGKLLLLENFLLVHPISEKSSILLLKSIKYISESRNNAGDGSSGEGVNICYHLLFDAARRWSADNFVLHANSGLHLQLSKIILALLPGMNRSLLERHSQIVDLSINLLDTSRREEDHSEQFGSISSALIHGVQQHLHCAIASRRRWGMLIAEEMALILQPDTEKPLHFEYDRDGMDLLWDLTLNFAEFSEKAKDDLICNVKSQVEPQKKIHNISRETVGSNIIDPDDSYDPEKCSFDFASDSANEESNSEDTESHDELSAYNVEEDDDDGSFSMGTYKKRSVIYPREVLDLLRTDEDADAIQAALNVAPFVFQKDSNSIEEIGEEIALTLINLTNAFELDSFNEKRRKAMISLLSRIPSLLIFLAGQFFGSNYGYGQRIEILNMIQDGSVKLSINSCLGLGAAANVNEQLSIGKTRRWGHAVKPRQCSVSKFSSFASDLFFALVHCSTKQQLSSRPFNVLASDPIVISKWVETLAVILDLCNNWTNGAKEMAEEGILFSIQLRYYGEPVLKRTVIMLLASSIKLLHPQDLFSSELSVQIEIAIEFLEEELKENSNEHCRVCCQYALSLIFQKRQEFQRAFSVIE